MSRFVFTKESLHWCSNKMIELAVQFHPSQSQPELTSNTPVYNAMADAIEWLDERPHGFSSNGELKQLYIALLNARTTVILNEDSNGFCTQLLEHASKTIPHWIALNPERRNPNLSEEFQILRSSGIKSISKTLDKL
jgi:hypothetical protein